MARPQDRILAMTGSLFCSSGLATVITASGGISNAIQAQPNSVISYGSEFRPATVLQPLFHRHPLWPRMESHLTQGASYPLSQISDSDRQKDLLYCLNRGNHKSAHKRPLVFTDKVTDEIMRGFYCWTFQSLDGQPRQQEALL